MTQSRSVCSRIRNARASLDNAERSFRIPGPVIRWRPVLLFWCWPPAVWAGGGLLRMEETPRTPPDYRDRQLQIKKKVRQAQIRNYLFPNKIK